MTTPVVTNPPRSTVTDERARLASPTAEQLGSAPTATATATATQQEQQQRQQQQRRQQQAAPEQASPQRAERMPLPVVDSRDARTGRVEDERAVWSAAPHRTLPTSTTPPRATTPSATTPPGAPGSATASTRRGIAEPTQAELDGWSRLAVVQRRSASAGPVAATEETPAPATISPSPALRPPPTVLTTAPSPAAEARPIRTDLFDCCGDKAPATKQADAERTPEPELDIDTQARLLWPRLRAMMLHELRIDRERSGTLRDTYR